MNATTTFSEQIMPSMFEGIQQGMEDMAVILWDALLNFLDEHWLIIGLLLFVVFMVVTASAMLGRWGALGSFLYNLLYFGALFVIGLIWGPEIFVSNWFGFFMALILYPVCYLFVGFILSKINLMRR